MEETSRERELRLSDFVEIFKRCWIVLLITMVVVFVGLYAFLSAIHVDKYEAEVTIYILRNSNSENQGNSTPSLVSDISAANALIDDCKLLMVSRDHVLNPVLRETPTLTDTTWKDLKKMIRIENSGEDRVLTLSVKTTDAEMSAELANKVAAHACEYFNMEYNQDISRVVDFAEAPSEICNPVSKLLVALLAFVAGIIVYIFYFLRSLMDDKINSAEDVEKYLGMSMLGMIPNRQDASRRRSKYGYYASSRDNRAGKQ